MAKVDEALWVLRSKHPPPTSLSQPARPPVNRDDTFTDNFRHPIYGKQMSTGWVELYGPINHDKKTPPLDPPPDSQPDCHSRWRLHHKD